MNRDEFILKIGVRFFLILFLLGCLFLYVVTAENTQQYNKIYLNPFYRASMSANTNYTYDLEVKPQDKVSNVQNAMVNFQVYISPSVVYSLWVNDKVCNNPTFTISTTYASAGLGMISFDCSNVINKDGNYKITLRSNKNSGSSYGWLDLTYSSDLKGELKVHGTEYTIGQQAKTWLQLKDINGTAISNGICYVDIYNYNNSILLEQATMNNLNHDGIYYYDYDTSLLNEGVYPVIARCYYVAIETPNFATSITIINGTLDSGSITNTYIEDGSYLTTSETSAGGGNPRRYASEMYFGNKTCDINELLMNGITIKWVGRWNSNVANDVIKISVYNYTSDSWLDLPNIITGSGTGVKIVSNSLITNNLTKSGLTNSTQSRLILKFNDTSLSDTSSTGFDYDYVSVLCDTYSSPIWQQVSGSSEMHINNPLSCSNNITYINNVTYYNNSYFTQNNSYVNNSYYYNYSYFTQNNTYLNESFYTYLNESFYYYFQNNSYLNESFYTYLNTSLYYYFQNNTYLNDSHYYFNFTYLNETYIFNYTNNNYYSDDDEFYYYYNYTFNYSNYYNSSYFTELNNSYSYYYSNLTIINNTQECNSTELNESLNIITGKVINIEGDNMATGYIILFIFNCVAFLFNMVKFKKPAFHLLIAFLFLGLTGMFNSIQLNVVATINMVLFVVSVITWIVLIKENRSNLTDGNI